MVKLNQNQFYCLSCRAVRSCKDNDICVKVYSNSKTGQTPSLICECPRCGANLTKFIKHSQTDKMVKKYRKC